MAKICSFNIVWLLDTRYQVMKMYVVKLILFSKSNLDTRVFLHGNVVNVSLANIADSYDNAWVRDARVSPSCSAEETQCCSDSSRALISNYNTKLNLSVHGNCSTLRGVAFHFPEQTSHNLRSLASRRLLLPSSAAPRYNIISIKKENHSCVICPCRQDGAAPRVWEGRTEAWPAGVEGGELWPGARSWESIRGILHRRRLPHPQHHQTTLREPAVWPPLLAGWVQWGYCSHGKGNFRFRIFFNREGR